MNVQQLLEKFGPCKSQPVSDWQGDFVLPQTVIDFYETVGPFGVAGKKGPTGISLQTIGNDILLFPLSKLWSLQAGYRWDHTTKEPLEDWPQSWVVVATDGVDPYIVDANTGQVGFILADSEIPGDLMPIAGSLTDVMGALALFSLRLQEAGENIWDEDYELRQDWVEQVSQELESEFGETADGVIEVMTEV